jgi:hypothetical protein
VSAIIGTLHHNLDQGSPKEAKERTLIPLSIKFWRIRA